MKAGFVLLPLVFILFFAVGCLAPGGAPPPTPAPIPNSTFTLPELKYILLDHYGESRFFYCDPDYYLVGRGDELARAIGIFPAIENMTTVFSAMVAGSSLCLPLPMHMEVRTMVRRTTPLGGARDEDLFRKGRDIADALKEIPEVAATEYKAGERGIRVIFAVPDVHAGNLIRRLLEKFRITPAIPDTSYRLGIYDVDDRNILLLLDTDRGHAGAIRDAVLGIRRC